MQVTKQVLELRLRGLLDQREQLLADLHAIEGATQVVEQLIAYSQEPEPEVPSGS